jgi:Smg protein
MFDILVYLFENYLPEACPEPAVLARKLSAIGFEEEAITEALDWLAGLQEHDADAHEVASNSTSRPAIRVYVDEEQSLLSTECRGFLTFLEQAGALPPALRELVIDRAMATADSTLSLPRLKVIVLMVMWRHQHSLDTLLLEELLAADDDDDGEDRLSH